MPTSPSIPYDVYESPSEICFVIPLGGVSKSSIDIQIMDYHLIVTGVRKNPLFASKKYTCLSEQCYRGDIMLKIALPAQIIFGDISSRLSDDSILHISLPKNHIPEKITVQTP